jgi:transposase
MLNDELWSKLKEIMLQHGIYDKPNLRMIVEAMLYRMRVGCPWRDLPTEFGFWNSIYQKFNRWSSKGKLMSIFKALVQEPDLEWEFIDGSIVKAHQHSAGAASEENQAIGKSRGGNTDMDWCLYKYRHLVENLFARIKHFRAIATRFDKLKRNYASVVAMACAFLWLPL